MIKKLMIFLVSCVFLFNVGCGSENKKDTVQNDVDKEIQKKAFVIDTKFGDIYYPEEHKDNLYIEELYEGHSICFYADINETKYHLFDVNLNYDSGSYVGEFIDSKGYTVTVYIESFELDLNSLEEETIDKLEKMQDDVNFILAKIAFE